MKNSSPELEALWNRSAARLRGMRDDEQVRGAKLLPEAVASLEREKFSIQALERICRVYADRPAIGTRDHDLVPGAPGELPSLRYRGSFSTVTYGELWNRIGDVASGCRHEGLVAEGQFTAFLGFSTVDLLVADFVCHYLCAVSVPLGVDASAAELAATLGTLECPTLFCTIERVETTLRALEGYAPLRTLVVVDLSESSTEQRAALTRAVESQRGRAAPVRIATLGELEAAGGRAGRVAPALPSEGTDPLMTVCFTSGSTGTPKAATYRESHYHVRWASKPLDCLAAFPIIALHFLPPNHMAGRVAVINCLKNGGTLYFSSRGDMSALFEDARIVRPTYLQIIPRISEVIYKEFCAEIRRRAALPGAVGEAEIENAVMSEMRRSFLGDRLLSATTHSAPTPPEVMSFLRKCFDIPVLEIYASSEWGHVLADNRVIREYVTDYKLVDVPELGYTREDRPFPRGELYVKTIRAFAGYHRNPEADAKVFTPDGYLRTNDIFEQRGPDQLVWLDRKNNVLKLSQGEFVTIWRLENVFSSSMRFIRQVYVHGESSRSYLVGVVVPDLAALNRELGVPEGSPPSDRAKTFLRAEMNRVAREQLLKGFEIPRDFVVESEPFSMENGLLTGLRKPNRQALRKKYAARFQDIHDRVEASQLEALSATGVPSGGSVRDSFRRTVALVLGIDAAQVGDSATFKDLGGDSLLAATLSNSLRKRLGVSVSPGRIIGGRATIADLAGEAERELSGEAERPRPGFADIHTGAGAALDARDLRLERFGFPASEPASAHAPSPVAEPKTFLITGANGFLGRFICLSTLERAARLGGRVYAIIRGGSDAEAAARLREVYATDPALLATFDRLADKALRVVAGDLERVRLGLTEAGYAEVSETVDSIIHSAALVNHALAYPELFDANVGGTVELMRLAVAKRRKQFNFLSTVAVINGLLRQGRTVREDDDIRALRATWPTKADAHAQGYAISKWAGEALCHDLRETFGVPVNVFRCGMILPHSRYAGQVNPTDFVSRLLCSLVHAGVAPESFDERVGTSLPHFDGLPVDFAAAAIAEICFAGGGDHRVFHVNNVNWADGVSLDSFVGWVRSYGYEVATIAPHAAWYSEFVARLERLESSAKAHSSLKIAKQWSRPAKAGEREGLDASRFREFVRSREPAGYADIPSLGEAYLHKYLDDLARLGMIPYPARTSRRKAS